MGMIGGFVRVSERVIEACKTSNSHCRGVLSEWKDTIEQFDVDSSWDVLHFVLSKARRTDRCRSGDPCDVGGYAIHGKTVLNPHLEMVYGPARYLAPADIDVIVQLLETVSEEDIERAYDPLAMDAVMVYPRGWSDNHDAVGTVRHLVELLRELNSFYQRVRMNGDYVIACVE